MTRTGLRHFRSLPLWLSLATTIAAGASWSQQNRPFDPGGDEAATPLPAPPPDPNQAPPPPQQPPPVHPDTPVAFQAGVTATSGAAGPLVLGELRWSCSFDRCKANAAARLFGIRSCADLARAVGPVTSFSAGGRSLSDTDLRACNASSASRPRPGITPTSGGLGARRVTPTPASGGPSSEALARAARTFRERAAALPASVYTTSCPYPFADGRLDAYVEASGRGDVQAARAELVKMDSQLGCMSAARFAGLDGAFRETILEAAGDGGAATIAPVVLLFLEYGGGAFREDYLRWLVEEAPALIAALQDRESWLARVGLLLQDRGSLVRISGEPAWHQLELASAGGLDSGRCTLLELTLLEDGDGDGRSAVFCPKDCQEILSDDERSEGLLAGTPPPEVQQECERRQQEKDRLRAARHRGIGDCITQFNANNPTMVACVADGLTGYRRTRLDIGPEERTREDIYAKRVCMRGNEALWRSYMDASHKYASAEREAQRLQGVLMGLTKQIREYNPNFDLLDLHDPTEGLTPSECMDCSPNEQVEHDKLLQRFHEAETDLLIATERMYEWGQLVEQLEERVLAGNDQCADDGTGCSDTCGIQDALAELTGGCLEEQTAKPEPDKPGGGGPSNPNVAMPDPLAPGALPGTVGGLQECLAAATGSNAPLGDPACYDKECPEGKVPRVDPERPGSCLCVDPNQPSEGGTPDFCPGYIDCPEDTGSACECVAIRDPGESLGEGGGGPTPRPGLGGPERGPYRIPLF